MPDRRSPTVLVTNAGHGSAVSIIRALGRRGCRVLAAGSERDSAGFFSRYVSDRVLYPSAEKDPDGCVQALHSAAMRLGVDLIIPVSDSVILPLSDQRQRFEGLCRLAVPEPEALETTTNKLRTLELAERVGVPCPKTHLAHTADEAAAWADERGWPVVLKPLSSRIYRQRSHVESYTVSYAGSPAELRTRMERLEGRCPVLLQEYYRGSGAGVEMLLHQGRPLAAFQHRRLREVPVTGGASALRESVRPDPALLNYAARLLGELKWTGLAMVEFKLGPEGPRLMEINGRIWGSLPLAVLSGMDFPGRLVDLLLGDPPGRDEPICTEYRVGVRARNLGLDLAWIASVLLRRRSYPFLEIPSFGSGLSALAGLADPRVKSDILSVEDPLPGGFELWGLACHAPRKLHRILGSGAGYDKQRSRPHAPSAKGVGA